MLPLLPIILLLLAPAAMQIVHLWRPTFSYHWLIAALGVMLAWPLVLLSGLQLPKEMLLVQWGQPSLFVGSPALRVDAFSWPFALALASLVFAVIFTAVVRSQQGNWRSWAGSCSLAALGLIAVQAGNPLTLLLAWAAIDLVELFILLTQFYESEARERIVVAFSVRVAGMILLIWAGVAAQLADTTLSFSAIPPSSSFFWLLSASLRLGVLPLYLPYLPEPPLWRGLGVTIRMVPAASSLVLLVRISTVGISAALSSWLLILTSLVALYAAISWLTEKNELAARPFWILGVSCFAFAAAIRSQPAAALAWSLACLLPTGILFLGSIRQRSFFPLAALGLLGFSTLPFTPAWSGTTLYIQSESLWQDLPMLLFFLAQVLLLAGYTRYIFRPGENLVEAERWVWVIYPFGLAMLPLTHFLVGWRLLPDWRNLQPVEWLAGFVGLGMAVVLWLLRNRITFFLTITRIWQRAFSLTWLYRLLWNVYQILRRTLDWLNLLLEGEAGILWTLLLLALIISMMSATSQGG